MAKQCIVFNTTEQLDVSHMTRLLMGIASTVRRVPRASFSLHVAECMTQMSYPQLCLCFALLCFGRSQLAVLCAWCSCPCSCLRSAGSSPDWHAHVCPRQLNLVLNGVHTHAQASCICDLNGIHTHA